MKTYRNYIIQRMSEKEYRTRRQQVEFVTIRAASKAEAMKKATIGGYVVIEKV